MKGGKCWLFRRGDGQRSHQLQCYMISGMKEEYIECVGNIGCG